MAYLALLAMHDRGNVNWATHIKTLLCECGFGLVWMFGGVENEKQFCRDLKEKLKANFCQRWFNHIQESARFDLYHSFKDCIGKEIYLDMIRVSIYRVALARFRMGVSPFNAHRHRYNRQENSRHCPFCPGQVEGEVHVVFICPEYAEQRARYIYPVDTMDMQEQINRMFVSNEEKTLVSLAKFLYLAWKVRLARLQPD
jgi:hypothetical protein